MRILFVFLLITGSLRAANVHLLDVHSGVPISDLWDINDHFLWKDIRGKDLRDSDREDAFIQAVYGCNSRQVNH